MADRRRYSWSAGSSTGVGGKFSLEGESENEYILVGSDEPVYERRAARRGGYNNGFYYEGDVDAEEIFRNFFFGGMNPRATTQFTGFSMVATHQGRVEGMQVGNGSVGMKT
ncbi:hypothetical protein Tco_0467559 [Tanacetum coccineum]